MSELKSIISEIQKQCEQTPRMEYQIFKKEQEDYLKKIIQDKTKNLSRDVQNRVLSEFLGWGPLEEVFKKTDIFEIMIIGPHKLWYEDSQGIHAITDHFLSPLTFRNFVQRLCQKAQIIVSTKDPYGDGDFDLFRAHIVVPPVSKETTITLRRHRESIWSLKQLEEKKFINEQQGSEMLKLLEERRNFLIVGPTGSGKTTLLNSLLHEISKKERMVIIEDTSELRCPNDLSVKMLTRLSYSPQLEDITQEQLVKQSLRMRPDRIVTGEIRGGEAKDLLQALATGHSGSLGTLHASSAKQALLRLEMLIQMGAPQWSLQAIRQLIHMSLTHIVVLNNEKSQKSVEGIYKVGSLEKIGFLIEKVS